MPSRMSWPEICRAEAYRGRWVALGECTYDTKTAKPVEGLVVDVDEDLAELCTRLRAHEGAARCAILFCDDRPTSDRAARSER